MKFTAKCPACDRNISIVRIMFALTPFYFSCGKCRSRIKAENIFLQVFIILIIFGSTAMFFLSNVYSSKKVIEIYEIIILFGIFFIAEFLASLLVCNKALLRVTKDKYNVED